MTRLLLLLGITLAAMPAAFARVSCSSLGTKPMTFFFFADPGTFSGSAEDRFFLENLKNNKTITAFNACGNVYTGKLMGEKVTIVTTGIGAVNAAVCTSQILDNCGKLVKEAIYMGTSGWSSAVGGILNPPSCGAANPNTGKGQIVRVGDICVSPVSMNWVCKKASWTQQCGSGDTNLCYRPEETNGPDASFLYGQCFFTSPSAGAITLSKEVLKAAETTAFPVRNAAVAATGAEYWGAMANGTGLSYYPYTEADEPTIFNYTQCAEVDGQFFYSGVPWEITARDYTAMTLNAAGLTVNATAADVVAVSAMEAIGFMQAFQVYNAEHPNKQIAYTNVRGASNWLHHPVQNTGDGMWAYADGDFTEDFMNGYTYAIASYSTLILNMYKERCVAKGNAADVCSFTVTYA